MPGLISAFGCATARRALTARFLQAPADRRSDVASLDWKRNDNPSHHIVELVIPLCA
jgi:hypothetical protein